ncbi:LysR substrate-binding domain-containing protein [Thalassobaculum salexigens]|uniref:LysR substrate-binding domain-containing protein n=1 Tax=Thalassobaculum salexigens TaxID=455360 RepID=UPI0003F93149|nr:LysR substrate-binding domain-containing protein [Thalassobaculum salexigens]
MRSIARHLPPLATLRCFEAAARHESFTLAADELGLTQAAVSKQVRQLEQDLGAALFERRNRAVFLTEDGRRLGRTVSAALGDIAAEATRIRGRPEAGEAILLCQLCEAFYWLMPRLSRFHERHPEIGLRVVSTLQPMTEATQPYDVALQTASRPAGSAALAFTAGDEIFPVCAPSLLAGRALPLTPEDLAGYPLLAHSVAPQAWMEWDDWFAAIGSQQRAGSRLRSFDSFPLVLQAAVAGQGMALGWRRTVDGMLSEGKLLRPCRESVVRPAEIAVYTGPANAKRPETRALLNWLAEELRD